MPLKIFHAHAPIEDIALSCMVKSSDVLVVTPATGEDKGKEFYLYGRTFNGKPSEELQDDDPENAVFNAIVTPEELEAFGEACIKLARGI